MLFTFTNKEIKIIARIHHSRNFHVCFTYDLNLQKAKSKWAIEVKKCCPPQVPDLTREPE